MPRKAAPAPKTSVKSAKFKPIYALGLMSGTSKDGVDVVRLTTDGANIIQAVEHFAHPYPRGLYARLKEVATADIPLADVLQLERDVTEEYIAAIQASGLLDGRVQVVGCHGQTIRHLPHQGLTWQLGDPNFLAEKLQQLAGRPVPVVMDFRRRDLAAGGEGAPLVPLFHQAMLAGQGAKQFPCALLNIGGVANVTYLPSLQPEDVRASDCGPGMGLLDQWVQHRTGAAYDAEGALAKAGKVNHKILHRALDELPFFQRPIPRSADRYEFNAVLEWLAKANTEDGAATLAALTVAGIDQSLHGFGATPKGLKALYLAGGGPRNTAVREGLQQAGWRVAPVENLGWQPLAVEAACFAWLAVRRLRGLPFSMPATTGCRYPTVGGVLTA
ncbi:MAG: anhydro-N-acetylmuramic acid kinase [Alphaproteobacteria bacterium]|nr:anhydro-N-acetylmuramic acid kinase [Alphaproteobacteria bacterium]